MQDSNTSRIVLSVSELKRLVHVDMPCFVKSSASAINMLGGEDFVCNSLDKDVSNIQLRFPGDNVCSSNQIGSNIESNGFLVKIRRRKNPSRSGQDVSTSVLGVVKKSYVFNNPSDYQVYSLSLHNLA